MVLRKIEIKKIIAVFIGCCIVIGLAFYGNNCGSQSHIQRSGAAATGTSNFQGSVGEGIPAGGFGTGDPTGGTGGSPHDGGNGGTGSTGGGVSGAGPNTGSAPTPTPTPSFLAASPVPSPSVSSNAGAAGSALGSAVLGLSLGDGFACAVVGNGIQCWGSNDEGQLGTPTPLKVASADWVKWRAPDGVLRPLRGVVSGVAAGRAGACALVDGRVYCWGSNSHKQLYFDSRPFAAEALAVSALDTSGARMISYGKNTICVVGSSAVKCWGSNEDSVRGMPMGTASFHAPAGINDVALFNGRASAIRGIAVEGTASCLILDQQIYCWGRDFTGENPEGWEKPFALRTIQGNPLRVSGASGRFCSVTSYGVVCWDSHERPDAPPCARAEYGYEAPDRTPYLVHAFQASDTRDSVDLAVGAGLRCITTGFRPHCMGRFLSLGLDLASSNRESYITRQSCRFESPDREEVPMGFLQAVTSLAISKRSSYEQSFACGVLAQAEVRCWGGNDSGQLGNASVGESSLPLRVELRSAM